MQWDRREFLSSVPSLAMGAAAVVPAVGSTLLAQQAGAGQQDGGEARDGVDREYLDFRAEDQGRTWGQYYRPKGKNPKTAILIMHPNQNQSQEFLTRRLAAYGYGVLGMTARWYPDPMRAVPESSLLDIAAQIKFLRDRYGVERFVGLGHPGGGSALYAFYQAQATTPPQGRFASTPAGDPPDLNKFDMPPLDALACLAPHQGEGKIFLERVDPSVVDESDPLATDPSLDMYDPRNGYRPPPESSKYSPEFIARYKAAQLERCKRLDSKAFELIARQRRAQEQMRSSEFARLGPEEQRIIRRTAYFEPYMVIYRTSAMLCMTDLSIDPSDRRVGDGSDPERPNFQGAGGMACVLTARGYLCTWSAIQSRMVTMDTLAKITVPTLIMVGTADLDETPGFIKEQYEASAAKDKTLIFVKGGTHDFVPLEPVAGGKNTQDEAARIVAEWLKTRFPA